MFHTPLHFIVVDDSRLDCFISEKIIKNNNSLHSVCSFNDAREALEFMKNATVADHMTPTVVLLDIQMPVMNGFDFAEAFEQLPAQQKSGYTLFMVSSSTNETDRIRMGSYPSIRHLYNKPISKVTIADLIAMVVTGL